MRIMHYAAGVGLGAVSLASQAALDLTGVTTALGDITTAVTTVGGIMVGAAAVAVAFKWVKAAIFG